MFKLLQGNRLAVKEDTLVSVKGDGNFPDRSLGFGVTAYRLPSRITSNKEQ